MKKKGDIFQLSFILIIIFIAAMVGILFLAFTNKVNDYWEVSGLINNSDAAKTTVDTMQATAPLTTDYAVFFLFLGSTLGICISAVRTKFSPTLIFFFLMLLVITVFIASGIVNVYSGFAEALPTEESQLTLTGIIFSKYLPLFMAIIGGIIMIIMYGKQGADIVT